MPAPLKVGSDGRPFEFDTADLVPSVNLGTGTAGSTTFLRGDNTWSNALTGSLSLATALNFTSTTTVTAGNRQVVATSDGLGFNTPTGTGHVWSINGSSVGILDATRLDLTSTRGIKFNSATGTVTAANREIFGSSTGLNRNVPTGGTHVWQVNGSTSMSLSSTALTVSGSNGLVIGANNGSQIGSTTRQIYGTSGGLRIHAPSKLYVELSGTPYYELTADGISFLVARSASPPISGCAIMRDDVAGYMRFNVPFNASYYFGHNGTTTFVTLQGTTCDFGTTNGFTFSTSAGSTTSTLRQIAPTSTGLSRNVPSGLAHIWTVANTRFGMLDGSSNKNIFFGQSAGGSVTTAPNIVAIGTNAAAAITTSTNSTDSVIIGSSGTAQYATGLNRVIAIGGALTDSTNVSSSASHIVALGSSGVLAKLTTGSSLIAIGRAAMAGGVVTANTAVCIGYQAGNFITSASNSVFIGLQCGYSNGTSFLTGSGNVGIGTQCVYSNTTGTYNLGLGYAALYSNTTNSYNVGIGFYAGYGITADECVAIGYGCLGNAATHTGTANVCVGSQILGAATSGAYNSALGYQALLGVTTGSTNTAIGRAAGSTITQGSNNISIGFASNNNVTTGSYNITIGDNIGVGSATGDRQMNIGGALTRDTSGNVSLNHGTTGGTTIFTTSSTALTLGTSIKFIIPTSQTPASAAATGTTGTIAWDADYIYVCTATNTWKRAAIATW